MERTSSRYRILNVADIVVTIKHTLITTLQIWLKDCVNGRGKAGNFKAFTFTAISTKFKNKTSPSCYPEWMAIKLTQTKKPITTSGLEQQLLKDYVKASPLVVLRFKAQAITPVFRWRYA
jgi:hypothetical protein